MNAPVRLPAGEFARRRKQLLAAMEPGSVALVPAAPVRYRNNDASYPYRQHSDFHYLTGFDEPEALLVLAPDREHGEALLFCRDRDARAERYDGERLGPERAAQVLKLDDAFPWADMDEIVPGLIEGRQRVYFSMGTDADFDRRVMSWVNGIRARLGSGALPPGEFVDIGHVLHEMRLVKSPAEQKLMQRAADISAAAHVRAMQAAQPGLSERDLQAELLYGFLRGGAEGPAYETIVGAGAHACVMHYVANDGPLADGDLVLIDAGAEYQCYAADITRTFPVNGRFSAAQRELYEVVLRAQEAAIAAVRPGAHFNAPHEASLRALTEGLVQLGLLSGDVDELLEQDAALPYSVHKTSHWLGMDVHDVGDYRLGEVWRDLEPGMVLTIEPGLYLHDGLDNVPAALRNTGVRIEDDVLVTDTGCQVLTAGVPKTVDEIEALMAAARS